MNGRLMVSGMRALAFFLASVPAALVAQTRQTPANVMIEFTFTAQLAHTDPFNEITLDARFTDPAGKELRVPAFWAGGNTWKVRYASPLTGRHRFHTECSDANDAGLNAVQG